MSSRGIFMAMVAAILLLPLSGLAAVINLPQTNYLTDRVGDDGYIHAGLEWDIESRFVDNKDGTVTDTLTGLMWLKDANCARTLGYNPDGLTYSLVPGVGKSYPPGSMSWQNAMDFVQWLNQKPFVAIQCSGYQAGYTDWRMPNINELMSLLSAYDPAMETVLVYQPAIYFEDHQGHETYWSSTAAAGSQNCKWIARMRSRQEMSRSGYPDYHLVWPVRGGIFSGLYTNRALVWATGQTVPYHWADDGALRLGVYHPTPRFTDQGDGTVLDNLTGLVWLRDANCLGTTLSYLDYDGIPGDGRVSENGAYDFISKLNDGSYHECAGPYRDWRLPNITELRSLLDYSRYAPALTVNHPFAIPVTLGLNFWSSSNGLDIDLWYGDRDPAHSPQYDYVWPVRGGLLGMFLPRGKNTFEYPSTPNPVVSKIPEKSRPIGLGSIAGGGDILSLRVALGPFTGAVDLYLAIAYRGIIPEFSAATFALVKADGTLQVFEGTLVPWRENLTEGISVDLFGSIPRNLLSSGMYELYLMATPAGELTSCYLWKTSLYLAPMIVMIVELVEILP